MDTRDISPDTYQAVIQEAADAHTDLALQFGMLAKLSKNEADYISKSKQLIELMSGYDAAEVDAIFIEEPLSKSDFMAVLQRITANISKL